MVSSYYPANARHGNLQKHLNPNPVQQWLLNQFHQQITRLIATTNAETILDAGCGEGFTLQAVHQADIFGKSKLTGVDLSAAALVWNQQNHDTGNPLGQADVHMLPFADNQFDLVYCLEVLEHLPDSAQGLQELIRVSRSYVLVSVPHEPFFRGANFLRGKHIGALGNDPEHLHNYSGADFRALVAAQLDVLWHGYSFPWQITLGRKR